eukprot:GHUV01016414.1.p1 GENE.GHUV01016414.1~~GHUV01016414.1.p1  ORF type:complete len:230 (+),score=70.84 GHUV01016414.1:696-1385(+)
MCIRGLSAHELVPSSCTRCAAYCRFWGIQLVIAWAQQLEMQQDAAAVAVQEASSAAQNEPKPSANGIATSASLVSQPVWYQQGAVTCCNAAVGPCGSVLWDRQLGCELQQVVALRHLQPCCTCQQQLSDSIIRQQTLQYDTIFPGAAACTIQGTRCHNEVLLCHVMLHRAHIAYGTPNPLQLARAAAKCDLTSNPATDDLLHGVSCCAMQLARSSCGGANGRELQPRAH